MEVVSESKKPLVCEFIPLFQELRVYKDPSLFLPSISLLYVDPIRGWDELRHQRPLMTTFTGSIDLMQLPPEMDFSGLISVAALTELYQRAEPKLRNSASARIIRVRICEGTQGSYADALGFVLVDDLKIASQDTRKMGLPPSVHTIPDYRALN